MAKTETTPRGLQRIFLLALGAIFLLQLVLTASNALQQYPHNPNLSSYALFFLEQMVAPIIMVLGAYFLNPRKISKLGKVFESVIIALAGQSMLQLGMMFAMYLENAAGTPPNADSVFMGFIMYQSWSLAITLLGYFATLVYLRQSKRWK